jgi:hypothetical protein
MNAAHEHKIRIPEDLSLAMAFSTNVENLSL